VGKCGSGGAPLRDIVYLLTICSDNEISRGINGLRLCDLTSVKARTCLSFAQRLVAQGCGFALFGSRTRRETREKRLSSNILSGGLRCSS